MIKDNISASTAGIMNSMMRLVITVLVPLLFLAGCGQQTPTLLNVGLIDWIGYQPLHIARAQGYYDDKPIKLVEFNNGTDVMQEFRTRQIEVAALTLDETMTMLEEGLDLSVILIVDLSAGGDALIAKPQYTQLAQLRGKTIAVEYTATGAVLLDGALLSAGMTLEDVEVESCRFDMHLVCYESADAVVTFEPVKTKLVKKGANVVFDSSSIVGSITDVLVVHKDAIKTHRNTIKELVRGYFRALTSLRNETAQAYNIVKVRTGLTTEELKIAYGGIIMPDMDRNRKMFNSSELQKNAQKLLNVMLEKDLLRSPVSIDSLFDGQFLNE